MSTWGTAERIQRFSVWPLGASIAAVFLDGLFDIKFPTVDVFGMGQVELDELVLGLSVATFVGSAFVMNHIVASENPDSGYFRYLPHQFKFWETL